MKMNMDKFKKLIVLIAEGLEYQDPCDEEGGYLVKISEDTLLSQGFSKEDTMRLMRKLQMDKVILTQHIYYAPHTTRSTFEPDGDVQAQATPNELYNKPIYYLWVDKEKLTPASDEPLSFDEATGLLHFHGKSSEIPFKSVQYYLLQLLTQSFGKKVSETDIADSIDPATSEGEESSSRVYDAHRRVNTRAQQDLGIQRLVNYAKSNYWINPM